MTIYEVNERTEPLTSELLELWERSVRATHHFLSDAEITTIKGYVLQACGFYDHMGFKVESRSELDDQGQPYPVLHLRRA